MLLQGGLTVGHRAHNPKIGGSIPSLHAKNFIFEDNNAYIY